MAPAEEGRSAAIEDEKLTVRADWAALLFRTDKAL